MKLFLAISFFSALSVVDAAGGLRKASAFNKQSNVQPTQRMFDPFDEMVHFLNKVYSQGSSSDQQQSSHCVVDSNILADETMILCESQDDSSQMIVTATGIKTETTYPKLSKLTTCHAHNQACVTVDLVVVPAAEAEKQNHPSVGSTYHDFVDYLKNTYDNHCHVEHNVYPPVTTIVCQHKDMLEDATLQAAGIENPIPQTLTICHTTKQGKVCHTIDLQPEAEIEQEEQDLTFLTGRE